LGAIYGDLRMADARVCRVGGWAARSVAGGRKDSERVRLRGCAGLARARRSEEDWRPRERSGFLLRCAVEATGLGGGKRKRSS